MLRGGGLAGRQALVEMGTLTDLLVPGLLAALCCAALAGKRDAYTLLITGAGEGLQVMKTVVPALVVLLAAVALLRESGAMEALTAFLAPVCAVTGLPPEVLPLAVIRPVSGSAALAVGGGIMAACGVDSLPGRTAAILLGSTETTFYVVSVYFGAVGIRRSRYAIPAALIADCTGFLMASVTARLFF